VRNGAASEPLAASSPVGLTKKVVAAASTISAETAAAEREAGEGTAVGVGISVSIDLIVRHYGHKPAVATR
jgi:hypothetical protein